MKSSLYQIQGCMGSQKYKEICEYDNIREARAEAKRRNQEYADCQGKSLIEHLDDLNRENHYCAFKSGFDGYAAN